MYIEPDVIDRIRNSISIEDTVRRYVPSLKKAGKNWTGLCPFHKEKTPSFTVSPEKQIFHCFGCNASGNVFTFISRIEHLNFPESVKRIADINGIDIPDSESNSGQNDSRSEMIRYSKYAMNLYYQLMKSSEGQKGATYFKGRGLSQKTIDRFKLGLAPDSWDFLTSRLRKQKADMELALKSGVISCKEQETHKRYFDRFRDRVMFPIFSARKEVVGFGGRVVDKGEPKYLNSPESALFKKGSILYGFDQAEAAIREVKRAIIVEGYMDVLGCFEHGIENVVAPLGTALTEDHMRILSRYCTEIILFFDSDSAGMKATHRAYKIGQDFNLHIKIAQIEEGDPFDLIMSKGPREFMVVVDSALKPVDFQIQNVIRTVGIQEPVTVLNNAFSILKELAYETERAQYIKRLALELEMDERHVRQDFETYIKKGKVQESVTTVSGKENSSSGYIQLLQLLWLHPHLIDKSRIDFPADEIDDPVISSIFRELYNLKKEGNKIYINKLFDIFQDGREMEILNLCAGKDSVFSEPESAYTDIFITMKLHSIDIKIEKYAKLVKKSPQLHHQYLAEIEILRREKEKLSQYMYNK